MSKINPTPFSFTYYVYKFQGYSEQDKRTDALIDVVTISLLSQELVPASDLMEKAKLAIEKKFWRLSEVTEFPKQLYVDDRPMILGGMQ